LTQSFSRISTLSLRGVALSEFSFRTLVASFEKGTNLKYLGLNNCRLTLEGAKILLWQVVNHPPVGEFHLDLTDNHFRSTDLDSALLKQIEAHKSWLNIAFDP
jgi:hypothetical protein